MTFFLANYVAKRYESGTTLYLGINTTIKIKNTPMKSSISCHAYMLKYSMWYPCDSVVEIFASSMNLFFVCPNVYSSNICCACEFRVLQTLKWQYIIA